MGTLDCGWTTRPSFPKTVEIQMDAKEARRIALGSETPVPETLLFVRQMQSNDFRCERNTMETRRPEKQLEVRKAFTGQALT